MNIKLENKVPQILGSKVKNISEVKERELPFVGFPFLLIVLFNSKSITYWYIVFLRSCRIGGAHF